MNKLNNIREALLDRNEQLHNEISELGQKSGYSMIDYAEFVAIREQKEAEIRANLAKVEKLDEAISLEGYIKQHRALLNDVISQTEMYGYDDEKVEAIELHTARINEYTARIVELTR